MEMFVDVRSLRELLSDDDVSVTGDLSSNDKLLAVLGSASGEVESSACLGQRYVIDDTRNDLAALTGNSALFLAEMVSVLAFARLHGRRPNAGTQRHHRHDDAMEFLEKLRLGERVFGILESHKAAQLDADAESSADVVARKGLVVNASRYFGTRVNRLDR